MLWKALFRVSPGNYSELARGTSTLLSSFLIKDYFTWTFSFCRGDHTSVDFFLTVLPPKTETVVFSIDGSFTASVSIMGKDPKVRAGAVDVVRYVDVQWVI